MQRFIIGEDVLQMIAAALGEMPAKHSFNALLALRNLEPLPEEAEKKPAEDGGGA